MPYEYQLAIIAVLALLGGALIAWFIMRPRITAAIEQGRAELRPELATINDRLLDREQTLAVAQQHLSEQTQ